MRPCARCARLFEPTELLKCYCSFECKELASLYASNYYQKNKELIRQKHTNNTCVDCGDSCDNRAIRCHSCASIGIRNNNYGNHNLEGRLTQEKHPNWTGGKPHCQDCGKLLKTYTSHRCPSCSAIYVALLIKTKGLLKGKRNPSFGKQTHGKGQWYKDYFMRSSWEVKFAKFLDANNITWLYESKTFDLGNCTYTPDFYLPETDEYIEIKGFWRDDAKFKYELTKIFYSEINLKLLCKADMQELKLIK